MTATMIITIVELLATVVEKLTSSADVAKAIAVLEAWLPTIIQGFSDLVPQVQAIIATLKGGDQLTADQITALDAMTAQVDAGFDQAAAAASAPFDPA